MQTYKITFKLNTPVSFIDTPTFDGVLYYAYVREYCQKNNIPFEQKLNIDKAELIDSTGMPITFHKSGYPMASFMYFDKDKSIEGIQKWRKRWANEHDSIADFGKNQRKIEINKGAFKSYDMPLRTMNINEVWFYFQTDNINEVKRLIDKWIHFIGKKRSQGYGEIDSFNIEKAEFDFTNIFRPIPAELIEIDFQKYEKVKFRYCAWKPPYWLLANFAKCLVE